MKKIVHILVIFLLGITTISYSHASGQSASLVLGQGDSFTSNSINKGGVSASSLFFPIEMMFDSSGNLWVSDHANNRVLEYVPPFTSGQSASLVLGQGDSFTSNSINKGGVSAGSLFLLYGLAFDKSDNLWVSDHFNNRVLEYTSTSIPEFGIPILMMGISFLFIMVFSFRKNFEIFT